ncbi:hypothetical protein [Vibrio campbellii]|uniref:hypothetical protein n=1 Tax=Vibrio campbellii TaxID=680 RepID=UPI000CD366A0|nr:hypothetical protein [Vibrio campbellii]AUV86656.1 hypothetical protein C1N50_11020 [Vibrio campbellii]
MNYKLLLLMAAISSTNVLADAPPGSEINDLYLLADNGTSATTIYANGNMSALINVVYDLADGAEISSVELRKFGIPGGYDLPAGLIVHDDYSTDPELPHDVVSSSVKTPKAYTSTSKYLTTDEILTTPICAKITTKSGDSKDTCSTSGSANAQVSLNAIKPIPYSISSWDIGERVSVDDGNFKRDYQTFTPLSFTIKKVIMDGAKQVDADFSIKESDMLFHTFGCYVPNAYVNNEDIEDGYTLSLYVYKPGVNETTKTCYYDRNNYTDTFHPPSPGCQDCLGHTSRNHTQYNSDFTFQSNNSITFLTTRNDQGSSTIDVRPYLGDVLSTNRIIVWDEYGNEAILMPVQTDINIGEQTYPGYLIQ